MKLAQDLLHLLETNNVEKTYIDIIEKTLGLTTIDTFALLGDSRACVRTVLKNEPFSLDFEADNITPIEAVQRRAKQARLIVAWDAACTRSAERSKVEASQRSSQLPLTIPTGDHVMLRRSFEQSHGRTDEDAYPAESVIERRFQEIEQASWKAESLEDVPSVAESAQEAGGIILNQDGSLHFKRANKRVQLPGNSEELRSRIKILGATYTLAHQKYPTKTTLTDATAEVWLQHLDHVLGKKVAGLELSLGNNNAHPPWAVILDYEQALRREAIRLVNYEGKAIGAALKAAWDCVELRQNAFLTPALTALLKHAVTTYGPSRDNNNGSYKQHAYSPYYGNGNNNTTRHKGKGQGKGSKGKGKSKSSLPFSTPDGRPICFAYNNHNEKCKGQCGRVHCCRLCFGPHPFHTCPKKNDVGGKDVVGGFAAPPPTHPFAIKP